MFPGKELPLIPARELDYREDGSSRLGDGAFGIVYRGKWRGNQVAIKALKMSALTPKAEEDFLQEMAVHSQLRHPNVVILYGAVTDKKPQLMVLELLTGSLYKLLHSETVLPWEERLRIGEEIGHGLDYLHNKQIIHRDLKSLNVLLDEKQRAKLSDFGLATIKTETSSQSRAQTSGGAAGTLPWMAPELFARRAVYSRASDVYAYAMTLWELSARKIPFSDAASPQLVMAWIKDGEREEIPADTPTVLREIITGCWVAEPKARPELSTVLSKLQAARGRPASPVEALTATFAGNLGSVGAGSASASAAAATFAGNLASGVKSVASPPPIAGVSQATLDDWYQRGQAAYKQGRYEEAIKWYRQAAEQGHAKAPVGLGACYLKGQGVVKDEREAVRLWRLAAEQGDAQAQANLGRCYEKGQGVVKDEREAVRWFQKAAEQAHAQAQYALGECYKTGRGVKKDEHEAVKWYRTAAEQGQKEAQFSLGACYANGQGVAKDEREAVKWYRKAAEQGHAKAQVSLGMCYLNGQGVAKDEREGVNWLRQAAEQGNALAQGNLGWYYQTGQGVAKDDREAVRLFRQAALQGDVGAQCNLGACYLNGQGVAKDEREGAKWYRKAAEQGDETAQSNLGVCYQYGAGVAKDDREAMKWYLKAAEQGDVRAQCSLGWYYHAGQGVTKDEREAVKWYRKAAEQGDETAQMNLTALLNQCPYLR